jgi:HSP20 family protein
MTQTPEKTGLSTPEQEPSLFLGLRRGADRLFDEFTGSLRWPSLGRGIGRSVFDLVPMRQLHDFAGDLYPYADVSESDKALIITAELPCMEKDDIDVTLDDDVVLSVRDEKKEEKDEGYYMSERCYFSFSRSFHMSDTVDGGKIKVRP